MAIHDSVQVQRAEKSILSCDIYGVAEERDVEWIQVAYVRI